MSELVDHEKPSSVFLVLRSLFKIAGIVLKSRVWFLRSFGDILEEKTAFFERCLDVALVNGCQDGEVSAVTSDHGRRGIWRGNPDGLARVVMPQVASGPV